MRYYIIVSFVFLVFLSPIATGWGNKRNINNILSRKGQRLVCVLFGLCFIPVSLAGRQQDNLRIVYEWKQLEFDYDSNEARENDIRLGNFSPGKIAPIDTDVHYPSKKVFISIPRFQAGVPVTLGTVTDKKFNNNPVIKPFPDWSWHRNPRSCNSNRMVSVFRVQIDECERLWVLDTGKLENDQVCPPQILAFDLQRNQLISKYEIPLEPQDASSLLVTPIVDSRGPHCSNTFVYMLDCQINTIFVYDAQKQTSWKIQDKTMYPFPSFGTYNIAGDQFDIMDGVLGGALSPSQRGEDRILFYHAMSSATENRVKTSVLKNDTYFRSNPSLSAPQDFYTYPKTRSSQSAAEAMDSDGILYFGLLGDITIACWNSQTEYHSKNIDIVASNRQTLQFPSGVKIVKNQKQKEELWLLTARFQKLAAGTLTANEVNFRILAGRTDDLLHGTKCKKQNNNNGYHG